MKVGKIIQIVRHRSHLQALTDTGQMLSWFPGNAVYRSGWRRQEDSHRDEPVEVEVDDPPLTPDK